MCHIWGGERQSQGWNIAGKGKSGIKWAPPETGPQRPCQGTACYPKSTLEPVKCLEWENDGSCLHVKKIALSASGVRPKQEGAKIKTLPSKGEVFETTCSIFSTHVEIKGLVHETNSVASFKKLPLSDSLRVHLALASVNLWFPGPSVFCPNRGSHPGNQHSRWWSTDWNGEMETFSLCFQGHRQPASECQTLEP